MRKTGSSTVVQILCVWLYLASASASQAPKIAPSALSFYQVAIAPDGNRVAWVQPAVNEARESEGGTAIYVQDLRSPGAKPRRITAAADGVTATEQDIDWSPDGKQLAFLSDGTTIDQHQLVIADINTGAARKLTSLTGYLSTPRWSPDGRKIAFLFTENAPRVGGPLMPMVAETGVIDSKIYEQRLTVVDVGSSKVQQLSPADMYVYEFDWSPDGKDFALTAAHGEGDSNWYVAQLYTLNLASGTMTSIYKPLLQIAAPSWSPDGKNIAFIGGLMSDEGSTGGDVFLLGATGGEARNVTPGIPASPSSLHWVSADKILFGENIDGNAGVGSVDVSTGKIAQLWSGPEVVLEESSGSVDISLAKDFTTSAVIRNSTAAPPEIWAGPVGAWKQITHLNQIVHPNWGETKSIHWNNDGLRVQGWLLYPKGYDASRRYPMVVVPHGGPAAAAHSGWPGNFFNLNELSALGYFVLYPNPRGSFGQGEAFTKANVQDFGYGDFRDILAGVDEVIKTLPVDEDRIGITGWSYGGYMMMWAVTHTDRFRAAVVGAGLANFQSYYGQNDIDAWMIPYFGASVYDDPAVYARSSPINFIKNAKTPTLLVVGERDGECPAPQSREFWHALKTLGVETQLVIYAGEGHSILRRDHQNDIMKRLTAWFDRYLKPEQVKN